MDKDTKNVIIGVVVTVAIFVLALYLRLKK